MSWEWVGQVAPAIGTVGAAAFGLTRGQGRLRQRIEHDIDLIEKLPEDTSARSTLLSHLNWQIEQLAAKEERGTRQLASAIWAFLFMAALAYLAVWCAGQANWTHWLLAPSAFFAALFLIVGVQLLGLKVSSDGSDSASDEVSSNKAVQ